VAADRRVVELEASPNVHLLTWLPVPTPPTFLDGRHRVVVPSAPGQGFFRLRSNAALYIVNLSNDFISFADFQSATGNVPPTTRLSLGGATDLFQPRATVVTASGRLLVSRGNGGIVGWNDAETATGNTFRNIEVDGANTGLGAPISFAYDRDDDRLFVGTVQSDLGIIVFDNVSGAGFSGNIAPSRSFSPDDRFPDVIFIVNNISGTSGNVTPTQVTVQGSGVHLRSVIAFDGELYFVDENNAAILVLDEIPTGSSASVVPSRVIEGTATRLSLPSYMHISRGYLGP